MTAPLSSVLRESVAEVWEAQHRHPFVTGIGDGTLDAERFKVWLRQDWLFLIEYARMLALGAARAPDLPTMTRFAGLTRAILEDEMSLHRSYAAEFGISESELDDERMLPTTQGYTDFLVRTASQGDFAELVAALLPCRGPLRGLDRDVRVRRVRGARRLVPRADRPARGRGRRADGARVRDQQPLRARLLGDGLVRRALAGLESRRRAAPD
jgi:hypothetical protein